VDKDASIAAFGGGGKRANHGQGWQANSAPRVDLSAGECRSGPVGFRRTLPSVADSRLVPRWRGRAAGCRVRRRRDRDADEFREAASIKGKLWRRGSQTPGAAGYRDYHGIERAGFAQDGAEKSDGLTRKTRALTVREVPSAVKSDERRHSPASRVRRRYAACGAVSLRGRRQAGAFHCIRRTSV